MIGSRITYTHEKLASNIHTVDKADNTGNDGEDDKDLIENFDETNKDDAKENCCEGK